MIEEAGGTRTGRFGSHIGFFRKISIHVALFILLTGIVLTTITYHQFRNRLFDLELSGAFTVYTATSSYLVAHYHAHDHQVIRDIIDTGLRDRFLHVPEEHEELVTHRPRHLVWYDTQGNIVYEFRASEDMPPAGTLDPSTLPDAHSISYDPDADFIHITGPLTIEGDTHGYLAIYFPTAIHHEVKAMLLRAVTTMLVVILLGILLSIPFTRQLLSPIRKLTRSASKVRHGNLEHRVPVTTTDEIGQLSGTFNDMVESLATRIQFMHRMQEWTIKIGSQLDMERLYDMLLEMFTRMSESDTCRIYLYDARKDCLQVKLETGAERLPAPEMDNLSETAFHERWAVFLRSDGHITSESTDVSELAIPMLSGKHRVGVVRIGPARDGTPYDDERLTILQTLAQQASIAIDNASLYKQLDMQKRIEQEMRLAREVQISMLPRKSPEVAGYDICGGSSAAYEVGGDYFDYVKSNRNWHVVIGDVSGKGMPAALIMTIVRSLVHTYFEFESSPEKVLRLVNRSISADLESDMFVTLSAIQLNPENHELRIARAGHEPVMLIHGNNSGSIENLSPKGAAIGLLEVEDFERLIEESSCRLQENDTVLLYTDGITEAQNEKQEEYGYERLESLVRKESHLPVSELYGRIIKDVRDFANNTPQNDDITLVILRRVAGAQTDNPQDREYNG